MAAAPAPKPTSAATYMDYLIDEPPPAPPPPRKKKMTKAEREERKRQEMLEFRKLEMYDHLRRELELSRKSSRRGQQMWMEMCRQIKLVQMREELKSWETKTNRLLAQKDEKIASQLDDFVATEQMRKRGLCMQLQIMDYLAGVFHAFQDNLKFQYETQTKEMLHDFYNKTCELSEMKDAYEQKFDKKLTTTNVSLKTQLFQDFNKSMEKRNDGVNDEIIKRYNMRDSIAKKMNSLHNQLVEFVAAILNTSLDALKYEKLNYLMQRQRNFVTESQKLTEIEKRNSHVVQDLQNELARVNMDDQRKINDLQLEHAYFLEKHREIEKRWKEDREQTHEKLKVLTTECYGICKSFQKLQKYGELLLSLSANCRKLQTESEKVTLWGDFQEPLPEQEPDDEQFKLEVINLKAHIDLNEDELQAQMVLMKNFWRRQALAEAQTVLLENKKRQLWKENQHYIDMIKSLSKADDVADLQKALKVQCVLDEEPPCLAMKNLCM